MDINQLAPGIYYQDILEDGSRFVIRQNFPTLKRVSFDKRPQIKETIVISVSLLRHTHMSGTLIGIDHGKDDITTVVTAKTDGDTINITDIREIPKAEGTDVPLGSRPFSQNQPSKRYGPHIILSHDDEAKQIFCHHDWNFELGDHEGVTKKTCSICKKIEFEHA